MPELKRLPDVQYDEEDPSRSAFLFVYLIFSFSGFLVGLFIGWLIWG